MGKSARNGDLNMRKLLLITALVALAAPAHAADMALKVQPRAVAVKVPCTVFSCVNKFYVGGGMAGNGTNANILGNGIDGSVFAGGGIPFVDVGWMTWNGTFMLGAEVGAGYQINVAGGTINGQSVNEQGYMAYQEFQLGGSLSGIINPGPAPVTSPTGLTADIMTPYISFGAEEHSFATGWRTGAGIKFVLPNSNLLLDIGYRYTNFGSVTTGAANFQALNLVYVKADLPLN
jgi:opacity protein-like surface antigen